MKTLILAITAFGALTATTAHADYTYQALQSCDFVAQTGCSDGMVCAVDNTCGTPCGQGVDFSCTGTLQCMASNDCFPACDVGGGTIVLADCSDAGALPMADGRCMLPCWDPGCADLGGACT